MPDERLSARRLRLQQLTSIPCNPRNFLRITRANIQYFLFINETETRIIAFTTGLLFQVLINSCFSTFTIRNIAVVFTKMFLLHNFSYNAPTLNLNICNYEQLQTQNIVMALYFEIIR